MGYRFAETINQMEFSSGYQPKDLHFDMEGRSALLRGVSKMAKAVKSTLGPSGNTVLIESPSHTHGITVTKDGVTVAKSIDLLHPVENLAVKIMKEAADKTATSAGDGTTTAIVLTEALVESGSGLIVDGVNRTQVLRYLDVISRNVVEELRSRSRSVTEEMVVDIASLSANNDREIGGLVADTYKSVGKDGIVTVEKSQTSKTYTETTQGMRIDRGYTSHLFINDHRKDECVLEDVMVLVSDAEISNIFQIEQILKPIITDGKRLLIIAPCSTNVLNTLAANVVKGNLKVCVIAPPSFGYKQHELMSDIALSVGAKYFSEKTGDDLSIINFGDLGHAYRVVVGREKTVLIKSDARTQQEEIDERVEQLWGAYNDASKKADRDFIQQRIASLTGGVGVIFVGGNTDLEQKELYDRVDDAVCAVRSAIEEGVLPGGGTSLIRITEDVMHPELADSFDRGNRELRVAANMMLHTLHAPFFQILKNAGVDGADSISEMIKKADDMFFGMNVKTGEYGDMIEMGVIDPFKVTRNAIENAVSVATTILSTNAIVTMARSYESK